MPVYRLCGAVAVIGGGCYRTILSTNEACQCRVVLAGHKLHIEKYNNLFNGTC